MPGSQHPFRRVVIACCGYAYLASLGYVLVLLHFLPASDQARRAGFSSCSIRSSRR